MKWLTNENINNMSDKMVIYNSIIVIIQNCFNIILMVGKFHEIAIGKSPINQKYSDTIIY